MLTKPLEFSSRVWTQAELGKSAGHEDAETGGVEGRAGEARKNHRMEGGQGGPETDLLFRQAGLPALPRDSSHLCLMGPVGQLGKALTPA